MDKIVIQKILDILYPELDITVEQLEILPRQQLNENNEWVPDSDAYFVGVKMSDYPSQAINIGDKVTMYTGYEFNVYRV